MAHVKLTSDLPGILGPLATYPKTAAPLCQLAQVLLTEDTPTFTKAEREVLASYVSYLNQCVFCSNSHGAAADEHFGERGISFRVWEDPGTAPISVRLRSLLKIAAKVQKDARTVTPKDVEFATELGATDRDIHDTVLIAAAFCMFNRYVDGLATSAPPSKDPAYIPMGEMLAREGYIR